MMLPAMEMTWIGLLVGDEHDDIGIYEGESVVGGKYEGQAIPPSW